MSLPAGILAERAGEPALAERVALGEQPDRMKCRASRAFELETYRSRNASRLKCAAIVAMAPSSDS
jgi:hypothetical protein